MFLALRELKHAKLRYLLIGVIMVLIVWLVLFVSELSKKGLSSRQCFSCSRNERKLRCASKRSGSAPDALCFIRKQNRRYSQQLSGKKNAEPLGVMMTAGYK